MDSSIRAHLVELAMTETITYDSLLDSILQLYELGYHSITATVQETPDESFRIIVEGEGSVYAAEGQPVPHMCV